MKADPARKLLGEWFDPKNVEHVWLEIVSALDEYDERKQAGPRGARLKRAAEILDDIETHARGLVSCRRAN